MLGNSSRLDGHKLKRVYFHFEHTLTRRLLIAVLCQWNGPIDVFVLVDDVFLNLDTICHHHFDDLPSLNCFCYFACQLVQVFLLVALIFDESAAKIDGGWVGVGWRWTGVVPLTLRLFPKSVRRPVDSFLLCTCKAVIGKR
uniref:Uncharacterized protein n=1 Tax=Caenorhabditis japonica TaxID=281687 RepID=A0A8R1HH89_CAEJA